MILLDMFDFLSLAKDIQTPVSLLAFLAAMAGLFIFKIRSDQKAKLLKALKDAPESERARLIADKFDNSFFGVHGKDLTAEHKFIIIRAKQKNDFNLTVFFGIVVAAVLVISFFMYYIQSKPNPGKLTPIDTTTVKTPKDSTSLNTTKKISTTPESKKSHDPSAIPKGNDISNSELWEFEVWAADSSRLDTVEYTSPKGVKSLLTAKDGKFSLPKPNCSDGRADVGFEYKDEGFTENVASSLPKKIQLKTKKIE
jgi:uncharacterized membrane protein